MPIEREFKYVLDDPDLNLLRFLNGNPHYESVEITQAYLGDGCRIRKSDVRGGTIDFFFTYKKHINGEMIEIETSISKEDYSKLFSVAIRVLTKTRINVRDGENCVWSFDYFWEDMDDDNPAYFVMAEFETKYDIRTAPPMPKFAQNYLVHVDDGTYDLTSYSLTYKDHADEIMSRIVVREIFSDL